MKEGKQLTMLDLVNSGCLLGLGCFIVFVWSVIDTLPHSGYIFILGMGIGIFGVGNYIYKYFRQPIKSDIENSKT
jgi:hypothetical protein